MRKAISELVVIVMLLMIAVVLAGLAFVFISGFQEQAKSETQQTGAESVKRLHACLQIDGYNFTEFYITVKNCGSAELEKFAIFADGAIIATDNATVIKPGETGKIFFENVISQGIRTIEVSANYNDAHDAEEIPKILLISNISVSFG